MESDQQDQEEMSVDIAHYHIMANTELVSSNPETSNNHTTSIQPQVASIARTNKDASVSTKTSAFLLSNNTYKKKGLPHTLLLLARFNKIYIYFNGINFVLQEISCRRYSSFPYRFI